MSVHTYIGARYVPRFIGTHDATQMYDALDVVDNGSGTSYIARKTVPAGTPLTDTNYWFVYGASSGAIIQLQNDVAALQTDVGLLKDRKFLFFGDSYDLTSIVGTSWSAQVTNYLNLDSQVIHQGGAGFIGNGAVLETMLNNATLTDADKITDVVILLAANDSGNTTAAILTAIQNFDVTLRAKCPNVQRISLGMVGWCNATNISTYNNFIKLEQDYRACASNLGWAMIQNISGVLRRPSYYINSPDTQHPIASGISAVALRLTQYLLHGYCDDYWKYGDLADMIAGTCEPISGEAANMLINSCYNAHDLILNFGAKSIKFTNGCNAAYTPILEYSENNALVQYTEWGATYYDVADTVVRPCYMRISNTRKIEFRPFVAIPAGHLIIPLFNATPVIQHCW